jgi:predicted DNA-binding transcriptional regulator AlpA
VATTDAAELPELAVELGRALADVLVRLATLRSPTEAVEAHDQLLNVHQAAERLGVAPAWLYRHANELPFTKKVSRKVLRFSSRGVERWISTRAK